MIKTSIQSNEKENKVKIIVKGEKTETEINIEEVNGDLKINIGEVIYGRIIKKNG